MTHKAIRTEPVFKYTSTNVAQTILVNRTIRYSSPTLFDDPLDVARVFDLGFPIDDLEAALVEEITNLFEAKDFSSIEHNPIFRLLGTLLAHRVSDDVLNEFKMEVPELIRQGSLNSQKHLDELNKMWQEMVPQMRILCFSKRKDILPLWATYGDNHRGVVLEFHPQESTNSPWLLAQSVTYSDEPMSIASPKEWARSILGIEKIDYSKIFERYGAVKTTNWAFQEEIRVFSFKSANETGTHSDYKFAASDLKAIYFGYQASDEDIQTLWQLLKYEFEHVVPYQLIVDTQHREFNYKKITL